MKRPGKMFAPTLFTAALVFNLTLTEAQSDKKGQAFTTTSATRPTQERTKRPIPKGVTLKGNRARAKRGYEFVRVDASSAIVRNAATKSASGKFWCSCSGEGGCSLYVGIKAILCSPVNCDDGCDLTVTVDPAQIQTVQEP